MAFWTRRTSNADTAASDTSSTAGGSGSAVASSRARRRSLERTRSTAREWAIMTAQERTPARAGS